MPLQPQTRPPPPQQHTTATTPSSSHAVPPPLATPPQNQSSNGSSEISLAPKSSNRTRTSSDSLLTTPIQKSSHGSVSSNEQNTHTRSFSVSDPTTPSPHNAHHQNGIGKEHDKSEVGRKVSRSILLIDEGEGDVFMLEE